MPSDNVRNLMLGRVVKLAEQNNGSRPNQTVIREATRLLDAKLNGGVALSDKDLRTIAMSAIKAGEAAGSGTSGAASSAVNTVQRSALSSDVFNTNPGNREGNLNANTPQSPHRNHHLPPIGLSGTGGAQQRSAVVTPSTTIGEGSGDGVSDLGAILANTTKHQRKILADKEWSRVVEEDRIKGQLMTAKEREERQRRMAEQKARLDQQKAELDAKREEEKRLREIQKQQVASHIAEHKQLTLQEQQEAKKRLMEERRVREQQNREVSEARERQRQEEFNEQVKRLAILNEQERAQKEADLSSKIKKQTEWRQVLKQNEERSNEKKTRKEMERAEDREFQRKYAENQERLEAQRRTFYEQKNAKQQHHLELAGRVASQLTEKEKVHLDKIQQEYEMQVQHDQEDEASRKRMRKQRMQECLVSQQQQMAEKKRLEDQRREDERRQAELVRQQIEENQRQEQARKMAHQQEQLRMRQFLNTQLQMAHFKETQEPETSIMRPPHVAANMFNTAALRSVSRSSQQ